LELRKHKVNTGSKFRYIVLVARCYFFSVGTSLDYEARTFTSVRYKAPWTRWRMVRPTF